MTAVAPLDLLREARAHALTRAIGIDAGKTTGWGVVDLIPRERVIAFGTLDEEGPVAHLRELIREHRPGLLGAEIVERVHPVRRRGLDGISTVHALALYRAGLLAGRLIETASALGLQVELFTAERWRDGLIGSPTADDARIDFVLRHRLADFPAPRKSSNHERDGIGAAFFALLDARQRAMRAS